MSLKTRYPCFTQTGPSTKAKPPPNLVTPEPGAGSAGGGPSICRSSRHFQTPPAFKRTKPLPVLSEFCTPNQGSGQKYPALGPPKTLKRINGSGRLEPACCVRRRVIPCGSTNRAKGWLLYPASGRATCASKSPRGSGVANERGFSSPLSTPTELRSS